MKQPTTAFDWNQVRAFLATAEEGSLSAAARLLGQTQPTLGRQVAALEQALGVTLFDRIGRSLVLTPTGNDLLGHVRKMAEAAQAVALSATGHAQSVEGQVCISAGDAYAAYQLPPVLAGLRQRAPGIEIELLVTDSLSDLRRREADIALRHVRPTEPDLIARRLRDGQAHLYAAPAWLRRHGRPHSLSDLGKAQIVGMDRPERLLPYLAQHGVHLTRDNFRLVVHSSVAAWEMVRHGLGLGIMSEDIAAATGGVERVCPDFPPVPVPVWLTTHRELHTSRRIRLVFDYLAEALGGPLAVATSQS